MPLPEYGGQLGSKRAAHLLRRAAFGPTKDEIETYAALTPFQAVTRLFNTAIPEVPLPIDPATGQDWITTPAASEENELQEYFKGWFIGQMHAAGVDPEFTLPYLTRERIVLFLHTHFTAIQSKINSSHALYYQNQLYRLFAFDKDADPLINIKTLTKKVSVDNAMLRLLDGNQNVKGSPNENYARELLELYSIGRGLEGSLPPPGEQGDYVVYTEQDVQEAARVLSGWNFDETFSNIDSDTELPRGVIRGGGSSHDNGVKQFSERFGGATIQPDPMLMNGANASEESMLDEISQLIELIYSQAETPMNFCRKIYRFFVYHEITQEINDTIIATMADTFISNGYKLQPVLENLFRSEHFYEAGAGVSNDNFGGIIKSPLDLIVGTLRFFEYPYPDMVADPVNFYAHGEALVRDMDRMGLAFYEPFDVAGYDAFHQFPIYHRSWISVNYLTNRYAFIRNLINNQMEMMAGIDVVNFVRNKINPATAANATELIMEVSALLFPVPDNLTFDPAGDDLSGLTAERLNYFLFAFLYSPQLDSDPEAAWTERWTNLSDPEVTRRQLENLFNALMQSPEYQLL